MTIKDYDNELLHMAHDLAVRLLPAFENTKTGIPYPRVSEPTATVGKESESRALGTCSRSHRHSMGGRLR